MMVQVPMLTVFVLMAHSQGQAPQQLVCSDGTSPDVNGLCADGSQPAKDKLHRT